MQHDRAPPKFVGNASELAWLSFEKLAPQYRLGGRCSRCEREGWLRREDLEARFGRHMFLESLAFRLRCRGCGNRVGNAWILGR